MVWEVLVGDTIKCMDDSVEYIETDYFPKTIKELDEFLEKRLRIVN